MGIKMAPAYANIFMGTLESRILSETTPSPIHWKRYIDDILLVWTDTKESLEQFIKRINDLHPHINFTAEFQQMKSHFYSGELRHGTCHFYTMYTGISKIHSVHGNLKQQMKLDLCICEALSYTSVPWKPYLWAWLSITTNIN